jgi:hypothetical protein
MSSATTSIFALTWDDLKQAVINGSAIGSMAQDDLDADHRLTDFDMVNDLLS